jgi:hypothetical protein
MESQQKVNGGFTALATICQQIFDSKCVKAYLLSERGCCCPSLLHRLLPVSINSDCIQARLALKAAQVGLADSLTQLRVATTARGL